MASLSVYLALAALLAERECISRQIREIIDEATDPWGTEGSPSSSRTSSRRKTGNG